MKALLSRVNNILLHPGAEWQVIKDEPATYTGILFRYVSILAVIPPAAAVMGRIIFDSNIPDRTLVSSTSYLILTNVFWYGMYILNVMIVGAIVTAIVTTSASRWNGLQGLKLAAYSFTPLFIAGVIAVFPGMSWIIDVAILYSIYLLYLGLVILATTARKQAIWYAVSSFLSAAVIVGVMNLFEYMLETFVTSRMFQ